MHSFITVLALLALSGWTNADTCPSSPSDCITSTNTNPGKTYCGDLGFLKKPSILSTCDTAQFSDCRDGCFAHPRCKSFSYAVDNSTCTYYHKSLIHQGYQKRTTDRGATFYSNHCFLQACCPVSSQIVENNSFETPSTATSFPPWTYQVASGSDLSAVTQRSCSASPYGYCHVAFSLDRPTRPGSVEISQTLQVPSPCLGQPFTFSAFIGVYTNTQSGALGSDFTFSVLLDDQVLVASGQPICSADYPCDTVNGSTDGYRMVTAQGTVETDNPVLTIQFSSPGTGNFFEAALLDLVTFNVGSGA